MKTDQLQLKSDMLSILDSISLFCEDNNINMYELITQYNSIKDRKKITKSVAAQQLKELMDIYPKTENKRQLQAGVHKKATAYQMKLRATKLEHEEVISIIKKYVKLRQDRKEMYEYGNRDCWVPNLKSLTTIINNLDKVISEFSDFIDANIDQNDEGSFSLLFDEPW